MQWPTSITGDTSTTTIEDAARRGPGRVAIFRPGLLFASSRVKGTYNDLSSQPLAMTSGSEPYCTAPCVSLMDLGIWFTCRSWARALRTHDPKPQWFTSLDSTFSNAPR
jgi:hypothetical protein